MKIYYEDKNYKLIHGKCEEVLDEMSENSIDSIVTDPPYDLSSKGSNKGFMGKTWDGTGIAFKKETWEKAFKVLKPGGYLLAFGGTRTYHRMTCAIEDAGFEIRDCIMWLYGSGFPKSFNVGLKIDERNHINNKTGNIVKGAGTKTFCSQQNGFNQFYEERVCNNKWKGYGTCLKPAYEPIIVARKPVEKSIVDNILKYSVGAINIDECRIFDDDVYKNYRKPRINNQQAVTIFNSCRIVGTLSDDYLLGRFPSNVILSYNDEDFDEVCGDMNKNENNASRYFYCAKASIKDRDEGLNYSNEFTLKKVTDGNIRANSETARMFGANSALRLNQHPTVKPCELMQYLIRLVTPDNGTILDIFNGSGSTGKAAMLENRERDKHYKYIGIEMTDEYLPISKVRIDYAINKYEIDDKIKEKETGQLNIFDFIGDDNNL